MTSLKTDPNAPSQRKRDQEIDGRYRAIGIAAVAAAVRFNSAGNKVKAPPIKPSNDERPEQAA